jgi:multiple sugar transport system substrate-binding protein
MRIARVMAAAVVVLLLAAACNESPSSEQDGNESISGKIVVQVSGEREETQVYHAVINAFKDAEPNTEVQLVEVAEKDDHLQKLTTSFAAGDPPDVFLVNFREYSQFVVRGAVEPFEGHLEPNGMDIGDYYEQPVEAFTYDDELQCMPQNISSLVVYYNRKLFKAAGIAHPESWTWDEFRAAAMKMTKGEVHGLGIDPQIIRIAPFVWSVGGEVVDDLDSPSHFTLDTPEARRALDYIVGLVRDDRVVPSEAEVSAQDLETRFTTGKLAMLLSSRRDTPVFREVAGLDWDVAPLPVGDQPAGILHSDAYCISAASDEKDAAARFISFATGEEGQTLTALAGRTVPSLKRVADSGAFLDPTQMPAHSGVFLEGIPNIRRTPVIPTWPEIEDVSEEFLTRLFYEEGYTIEKFLSDLDAETRPLFEEGGQV